jgi:hypothetical protein
MFTDVSVERNDSILYPEEGYSKFLRKGSKHLPDYTVSYPVTAALCNLDLNLNKHRVQFVFRQLEIATG